MDWRQSANAFYLAAFILFAIYLLIKSRGGKETLVSLLRSFFESPIAVVSTLIIIWNAAIVYLLHRIGYWTPAMAWDTLMFVAFGAFGSLFGSLDKTYNLKFFAGTVLKYGTILAVLEFVTNWYTFGLWEFILVPSLAFFGTIYAFSQTDEKYSAVTKLFGWLISAAGFTLLGTAMLQVAINYRSFFVVDTAKTLLLPLVLALAFAPLLYLLCGWLAYDKAMRRLWWKGDERAIAIRRWKKWRLLLRFGGNLAALQAFSRSRPYHEYKWACTKDEAKRILRGFAPQGDSATSEGDTEAA